MYWCSALIRASLRVKDAGSFASLRGYNLTTASGVGAAFACTGLLGGETGRVTERGSALLGFAGIDTVDGFSEAFGYVLVSLFPDGRGFFGAIDPTKIGFVVGGLGSRGACKAGCFVLSLSVKPLAFRSPSSATVSVALERRVA
jgi:hypothetical protein